MISSKVQEEVTRAFDSYNGRSSSSNETERSPGLQLKFTNDLPDTLFTGNVILSVDKSPLTINLYDPISRKIVTTGPLSSSKVNIVVLDGDFALDKSSGSNFDGKALRNREGKRPLLTGEQLVILLQKGVGYIREVSFTDNSKWTRSGKFRLGLKICTNSDDQALVRHGISNAFKVKDHRGESYEKHYPPSLDDEVWRLKNIARNGTYFKKLSDNKISCVGDLLRLYHADERLLRYVILSGLSVKNWQKMIEHAMTCVIDEQRYMYRTANGILLFDSIYRVVGVSFDGHNYISIELLNDNQKKMVEYLKKQAYRNLGEIAPLPEPSSDESSMLLLANQMANNLIDQFSPSFGSEYVNLQAEHDPPELQLRASHATISPPNIYGLDQNNYSSFEFGESSSQTHGPLDPPLSFSFSSVNPRKENYTGGNFMGSNLSSDCSLEGNFQASYPFLGFNNQESVTNSSEAIIFNIRKAKTRWCKVVAVLKWWILFKAGRRLNPFLGCI